jgi:hypothetical protein
MYALLWCSVPPLNISQAVRFAGLQLKNSIVVYGMNRA